MTTEDVIHDFSVPAFRVKHDVLPGRYESCGSPPTKPGTYHLFCTQFCGTDHAAMVRRGRRDGRPISTAGSPAATTSAETWSPQGQRPVHRDSAAAAAMPPTARGAGSTVRAPVLDGLYGSPVPLADGTVVIADDQYIRDSILLPRSRSSPATPRDAVLRRQIGEEDSIKLIAYIKSLGDRSMQHERNDRLPRRREMPPSNYLTEDTRWRSWLLTTDHKRIALLYLGSITLFFFIGGAAAALIRLNLLTPDGAVCSARRPTTALFTHARRDHGLVLPGARDPGHARQFPRAADDRRARSRLPAPQPAELVPVHGRRRCSRCTRCSPAASIPAGPSTRRSRRSTRNGHVVLAVVGIFIAGFSSIPTGLNFIVTIHKLRAPGHDLVSAAAVRLVALRHQRHLRAGHAGAGDDAGAARARADVRHRHLRPDARRRPAAVPAPVLVLLATRPSTS